MAADTVYLPESLTPQLSENQKIIYRAQPAKVFIADPNPPRFTEYFPPPAWISAESFKGNTAAFRISYVGSGDQDLWGATCQAFPAEAKGAFTTAANIWAKLLHSRTPITIRACWGDLGADSSTLGYSGGGSYIRDFPGAPRAKTWYASSLANALHGEDMIPSEYDMHITFNSDLPGVYHWNYRPDGNVDSDEFDFLTVALHEICHGLGFMGSMNGGSTWGIDGYPLIYDVFTRDTYGTRLIDYDGSYPYTLPETLTAGQVFFHGSHAMAANGGKRVELFTPDTWMPGSSYSHLSMNFNGTSDKLMVYMLSLGNAIHSPGPITLGLLKDVGWPGSAVGPPNPPPERPNPPLSYLLLLLGEDS
ncbi:MAG: hypothetical protein V2I36_06945 [Desulfopila sp.]|nr:hypothetical protein [Desulfopila sp.]